MNSNSVFDFVVIGGGLAGLVVATRLAEDPNITVGILEAGQDVSQSLNTKVPGFASRDLANPEVIWSFLSTLQPGANDRPLFLSRGKSLGGSSNLNFFQLGRASAPEYDAFETLGSKGWNWQELLKYFKKSENIGYSRDDEHGVKPELEFHGTSGPVFKTLPLWTDPMIQPYVKACENLGIPLNTDSAYYEPNKSKPNLVAITGAHVTRIIFNGKVAEAVEYLKDGELQSVSVKKEVILSAGSFQTPQILELSGIGDKKILQSHGIPVVVNLPGVGRNYQDHWYARCIFEINTQDDTLDVLTNDNRAAQEWKLYDEKKQGMLTSFSAVPTFIPSESVVDATGIREVASKLTHDHLLPGVQKTLNLQREWLTDNRIPQVEIILTSGFFGLPRPTENDKRYLSISAILLHPFSRGEVHLSSSDPLAAPTINPNVFDNDVDVDLLVESNCSVVVKEVYPGTAAHTDEEIKTFTRNDLSTTSHPVGTASMLPEEDGGVVDANLKVYGTANLCVVDASIIPIQLAAHTQATVYGIAEKGADIIKSTS